MQRERGADPKRSTAKERNSRASDLSVSTERAALSKPKKRKTENQSNLLGLLELTLRSKS